MPILVQLVVGLLLIIKQGARQASKRNNWRRAGGFARFLLGVVVSNGAPRRGSFGWSSCVLKQQKANNLLITFLLSLLSPTLLASSGAATTSSSRKRVVTTTVTKQCNNLTIY